MTVQPRTLTQMQRRPTSYEVSMVCRGQVTRLAFTQRTGKSALLRIVQQNSDAVIRLMGDWDDDAQYSSTTGWTFGPVRVHFTGATERDVANAMNRV